MTLDDDWKEMALGEAVAVIFDGETAKVVTSDAFKGRGWLGAGVVLDGAYAREGKEMNEEVNFIKIQPHSFRWRVFHQFGPTRRR